MGFKKTALVFSLLFLGQTSATLPAIVMKGSKFFYENGTQFFIKGVAYQQEIGAGGASTGSDKFVDPLASESNCKRDVPLLKALGTNTIRTYAIDPKKDHSACMKLLSDAGIYVISDLSEPALSIVRDNPKWNLDLYKRYTDVIDELSKYDNVIGFFAGNEVTNNATNTDASAFVKAAVRDTKAHIKKNSKRWMGVGYAANDDAAIRADIAHYFNCGPEEDAIDFWGYNIYEWCGHNTYEKSGYAEQVQFFENYSVPVFFAEYGCNTAGGAAARIWEETTALYSDEMTGVVSGGIVYMYFQEANDYGLVKVSNGAASTLKDYDTLKTKVLAAKPSATSMDAYTPTNKPAACPDTGANWAVKGEALPPTPDKDLCDCMFKSLSCVPSTGLNQTDYKPVFDEICGNDKTACDGISHDTEKGVYGPYSMCDAKSQLGWILTKYYQNQNTKKTACDWKGSAVVNEATTVDKTCSAKLQSATEGASSPNVASPIPMGRLFAVGDVAVGLYVVVAMAVGGVMVL